MNTSSKSLLVTTAIAGVATVVLQFAGQGLIQVGGAEPPFDAPAGEISAFFAARDQDLFAAGSYLSVLSVLALLWFLGGTYALFRPDWRAPIALACGILYATGAGAGWDLAVYRVPEGVDPQLSRFAFDLGNLSFASGWVALGGFAIATGWLLIATQQFQRWLGWWAVAAGVCLIVARAVWTTPFWFLGYGLFWIWVIVLCALLLRRAKAPGPADASR
jgi:hypothetical protein